MKKTGMTTLEVRTYNKSRVYEKIYEKRSISKQEIATELEMSLTTVTQNLKLLEAEGRITITGQYQSTGGRKANAYSIVPTAAIAIGIDILKDRLHFVAIDLYGEILQKKTMTVRFFAEEGYYKMLGESTQRFIAVLPEELQSRILGVGIAVQGLVSADGQRMEDGRILNCERMTLSDLSAYIPYPCHLEHDSTATAATELWQDPSLQDAIIFILNHNIGGAVIMNGKIHYGLNLRSGVLEHMQLREDGPLCYCGKKGCLETYCSLDRLEQAAGTDTENFFFRLRNGDRQSREIWLTYMDNLALAVRNMMVILDCDIVLSGYLAPFLNEEDVELLKKLVQQKLPYPLGLTKFKLNHYGEFAPATGVSLLYIKNFLKSI